MHKLDGASRQEERDSMVDVQLRTRGISDARVLSAMREVPREAFVPEASREDAYSDCALPIGEAQTISQPYIVARTCELAAIQPTDRVLEVGGGSGYQAAVLARLARQVVTIERIGALAQRARKAVADLGIDNVTVVEGDGQQGYALAAPYDAILVAAGTNDVPDAWLEQLADGGRLVVPLGDESGRVLTVLVKQGKRLERHLYDRCMFVPLLPGTVRPAKPGEDGST